MAPEDLEGVGQYAELFGGLMHKVDIVFGVFQDVLRTGVRQLQSDSDVSDAEISTLFKRLRTEVDQTEAFLSVESISPDFFSKQFEALKAAAPSSSGIGSTVTEPRSGGERPPISYKLGHKQIYILGLLSESAGPLSLDQIMSAMISAKLVEERQRSSVVTILRRLRADAGLIDSPYQAHYTISTRGVDAYRLRHPDLSTK